MKPRRLKILYVNYCLSIGGIETMIAGLVTRLPKELFDISIAVFEGNGVLEKKLIEQGISIHYLNKREGLDFNALKSLFSILKTEKIDVIHTHNFSAWLYSALAARFVLGVNVIHTEHSTVRGKKKRRYLAEWFLSYLTESIVAVSEKVKDNMVKFCHINPDKVLVIQNGIDVVTFQANTTFRSRVRKELAFSEKNVVFGTVGRLVPVKDHLTLINAFFEVYRLNPNAKLIIVGDGPMRKQCLELISDLNLEDSVYLLGERHDIPQLLALMDIYTVSSLSEGMSISILEAMSTGLPVVATNVGGNPEIVQQDVNGLLVRSGDPKSLAEAMNKMSTDRLLRSQASVNSRKFVEKNYSDVAMMARYQKLYSN